MEQVLFKIYTSGKNFKMIITEDTRYKGLNTVLFPGSLLAFQMSRICRKLIGDGKLAVFTPGN